MAIISNSKNYSSSYHLHTVEPMQAKKRELLWLIGLILSFAHERPILVLTSMDRINPRLFDVMVVIGVLLVLPRLRRAVQLPQEFYYWAFIVTVFVFCAVIYAAFLLPFQYGAYSLFFAAKYLQCLLAIYLALKIPLSQEQKVKVMWSIAIAGTYVAMYCIFQFFTTSPGSQVEVAPGKFIRYFGHVLTGPLSYSYLHLAVFSPLCAIVTLSLIETVRGAMRRWSILALAAFISWPMFFSGSRTGLGVLVFSVVIGLLLLRSVKSSLIVLVLVIGVVLTVVQNPLNLDAVNESNTFSRFSQSEGSHNSIANRLSKIFTFEFGKYKWGMLMPLIGGGFYTVPVGDEYSERYRVGYGIHNSYLFPLEQGGLFAFFAYLIFLIVVIKKLNWLRRTKKGVDRALAVAALSYMLALLPAFLAGPLIWIGGTGNFNALFIIFLLVAIRSTKMPSNGQAALVHLSQTPSRKARISRYAT